ncbi:unnamed protein product [Medioppia subpectinata]|uniref:C2H2-type domain-containing protein n=1 Tax=Medioppia subpectinata TaxID=1979941 RepID=A0A7R9KSE3_9ACAR|nr:unnamed protein product [Medioppia subpectinata]CAG2107748.1 unnamed protein product [Medioppia subpectinata]
MAQETIADCLSDDELNYETDGYVGESQTRSETRVWDQLSDYNEDSGEYVQRLSPTDDRRFWEPHPVLDRPFHPKLTVDKYLLDPPKRVAKRQRSPSQDSDDWFINDGPVDDDYEAIAKARGLGWESDTEGLTTDDEDTDEMDTDVDDETVVDHKSESDSTRDNECEPQYVCLFCAQSQRLYCEAMDHMISHFPDISNQTVDYGVERRVRSWCKEFLTKQSAPEFMNVITDESVWTPITGHLYCPVCERVADMKDLMAKPFDTIRELRSHLYKHSCWAAIECGLCHESVDNTARDILQHLNAQHKHSLRDSPVEAIRQLRSGEVLKSFVGDLIGKTSAVDLNNNCGKECEPRRQRQAKHEFKQIVITADSDTRVDDNEDMNGMNSNGSGGDIIEEIPSDSYANITSYRLTTTPAPVLSQPLGATHKLSLRCDVCHSLCDNSVDMEAHSVATHPNLTITYHIIHN